MRVTIMRIVIMGMGMSQARCFEGLTARWPLISGATGHSSRIATVRHSVQRGARLVAEDAH